MQVPSPGLLSISSVPPSRDARSRMDFKPRCPRKEPEGSKPAPSSEISRMIHPDSSFICTLVARACLTVLCRAFWAIR